MVGSRQRFEIVYEAGPHGIAEGGTLFLLPSPFWGWDPPQLQVSVAAGYTEVTGANEAPAIIKAADAQLYAAKCAGRNRTEIVVDGARIPTATCAQ